MRSILITETSASDRARIQLERDGYALLDTTTREGDDTNRDRLHDIVSDFFEPIVVFEKHGMWRAIGVDLVKHPNRSEGTGASLLHMDFVNAQNPPDFVVLLCIRPDPLDGGNTVIAPISAADNLSDEYRMELSRRIYRDGRVVDLLNVGHDINPFPVLGGGDDWSFRFTANLLTSRLDTRALNALESLYAALLRSAVSLRLKRGETIIIDQKRWVHGKTPLGIGQESVEQGSRRLLLQMFGRRRLD